MSRTKGEGTLYETIQKIKKPFDNTHICTICANCDKVACGGRKDWTKCIKCKECKKECLTSCDRFRCYRRAVSQIYENLERHTVGTGKSKKEANQRKKEKLSKGKLVNKDSLTLIQAMKNFEQEKSKYKQILDNSYNRNLEVINSIYRVLIKLNISKIKIQNLTEKNIKDILVFYTTESQSQLEKVYDELNGTIRFYYDKEVISSNIMKNIKRNSFISEKTKKNVEAFSVEETKILLDYIDKNQNELVKSKISLYDTITVKNFIILAFATAMRCGELGALNIDEDIDIISKKFIVKKTLTNDKDRKIVIGKYTKTGRKQRQSGSTDERTVPFGILFSEEQVLKVILEQIEHSKSNPLNTKNLLFCKTDGSFINHSQITSIFKRICREAGIKLTLETGCAIHMTKHSGVSRMIENGIDIYVISKLVGTTVEVLRKTYAHIFDNFIEREIQESIKKRENIDISSNNTSFAKIIPFSKTI